MSARLNVLASASKQGPGHVAMEDRCGFTRQTAWIIDGATCLDEPLGLPGRSDAEWMVDQLDSALLRAADLGSPADIVRRAIEDVDETAQLLVGDETLRFPSAAITLVTVDHVGLRAVLLADCWMLVEHMDETVSVFGRVYPHDMGDLATLRRRRTERNTERGLWVARREPHAVDHAVEVTTALPSRILLASDGAWAATEFGVVNRPADLLLRALTQEGAEQVLSDLGNLSSEAGRRMDDACLLVMEVVADQGETESASQGKGERGR